MCWSKTTKIVRNLRLNLQQKIFLHEIDLDTHEKVVEMTFLAISWTP